MNCKNRLKYEKRGIVRGEYQGKVVKEVNGEKPRGTVKAESPWRKHTFPQFQLLVTVA